MYCNACGNQIPGEAKFCSGCGAPTVAPEQTYGPPQQPYAQQPYGQPQPFYPQQPYQAPPAEPDVPNTALNVLSFFFPIVGFIIYAVSHTQTPVKAKAALKMSIISVCVWVGIVILFGVLGVMIPMLMYL